MVKVYKKNDKLAIYLPFDLINELGVKENDEVDFFKFNAKSFLIAKKSDLANLLVGNQAATEKQAKNIQETTSPTNPISEEEIIVLKKMDTVRYPMRTVDKINSLLEEKEKKILRDLLKKKAISLFLDKKSKTELYSISNDVYNKFLMRKKMPVKKEESRPEVKKVEFIREMKIPQKPDFENDNVRQIEQKGFAVINTEAEAASVSLALEASIRQGLVLGTRAFNKKFYIMLRVFFEKHSGKIIKMLQAGDQKATDIANKIGLDEEATRGILYLLSEAGDISERKRDVFTLA